MSEFLLIIPAGWVGLDWQYIANNIPSADKGSVENAIASNMLMTLEPGLKEAGCIPQEATIVEAKLIDDTYFLVKLG